MKTLLLFAAVPALCLAQSIGQIGISAAGGSAAGAAGKKVSDAFDHVMGKGAGLLDLASKTGERKPAKKNQRLAPLVPPEPSFGGAHYARPSLANPSLEPRPSKTPVYRPRRESPAEDLRASFAGLSVPPPPVLSPADYLRAIEPGASRDAVLEQVGKPAGRITMYDDRGLVEVYSFRQGRESIGSVRLVNGTVTEVKLP
jgi:hypothetical protein